MGLQGPRGTRSRPRGSQEVKGDIWGVPEGQGGYLGGPIVSTVQLTLCLGDPMGPSGWFDESSDDSLGIYACI